jgi:hypothetical protein
VPVYWRALTWSVPPVTPEACSGSPTAALRAIDSIAPGGDFIEVITSAVGSCDVLLALIGDRWLTIADEDGRRRLDNPDDFVRLEIEAALTRNVRVIPILVDGAQPQPIHL